MPYLVLNLPESFEQSYLDATLWETTTICLQRQQQLEFLISPKEDHLPIRLL